MKVRIRKIAEKEAEQVIVECVEITQEIKDICAYVGTKGRELAGVWNGRSFRFPYGAYHFIRCSKSVLLNLMQLESISPALNGRFFAHMNNKETVMISRAYVPKLKAAVMGEEEKRV